MPGLRRFIAICPSTFSSKRSKTPICCITNTPGTRSLGGTPGSSPASDRPFHPTVNFRLNAVDNGFRAGNGPVSARGPQKAGGSFIGVEDLGDSEKLLQDFRHFAEAARRFVRDERAPTDDGWGGWPGKYQAALRESVLEISLDVANPELADKIRIEADYFERNAARMRYPEFRSQHLFIGSGVIEAGCKTVIGSRLKQSGMFRTVRGANAIIALRCHRLSGKFEDYWASRSQAA